MHVRAVTPLPRIGTIYNNRHLLCNSALEFYRETVSGSVARKNNEENNGNTPYLMDQTCRVRHVHDNRSHT